MPVYNEVKINKLAGGSRCRRSVLIQHDDRFQYNGGHSVNITIYDKLSLYLIYNRNEFNYCYITKVITLTNCSHFRAPVLFYLI